MHVSDRLDNWSWFRRDSLGRSSSDYARRWDSWVPQKASRTADIALAANGSFGVGVIGFRVTARSPDSLRVFGRLPVTGRRGCTEAGDEAALDPPDPPRARRRPVEPDYDHPLLTDAPRPRPGRRGAARSQCGNGFGRRRRRAARAPVISRGGGLAALCACVDSPPRNHRK
jgi:hypothetical protein